MEKPVLMEVIKHTALITLNRPERRNALNRALLQNLYNCLDEATRDAGIRAVVITGKGKSFCSGIDLDAVLTENIFDPRGDSRDLVDILGTCGKPVIAAVNGHAITGGFEIALNCDFIIASKSASFADTHAKVGIHPGWGMTQLLQEAVGIRMAKELSFTCRTINADEAMRIGLVNEVVDGDDLLSRSMEIAEQAAGLNQGLLTKMKELIDYRKKATHSDAFAHERMEFRKFVSDFMEKINIT